MSRTQIVGGVMVAALVVVVAALLLVRGDDDSGTAGSDDPTANASELPVVPDETWCTGWKTLVSLQGQYVASPTPEAAETLLATVDDLQSLGVPESLDPDGYTELTAVLDDIRASVDPSFTPTAVPSEPADVAVEDDEEHDDHEGDEGGAGDEGDEHEDHGADAEEAPFGAWLAEYCSV